MGAKREGEEAGRARGSARSAWGGWIEFWGGIKRLYTLLKSPRAEGARKFLVSKVVA